VFPGRPSAQRPGATRGATKDARDRLADPERKGRKDGQWVVKGFTFVPSGTQVFLKDIAKPAESAT